MQGELDVVSLQLLGYEKLLMRECEYLCDRWIS